MSYRSISYMLVCHSYPPIVGGSEIEAQRVSDELQKRGHHPRIVCAGGDPMPAVSEWVDPYGLRVRLYGRKQVGWWRDAVYSLGVAWTLIKERKDYDVAYFLMHGLHLITGLPIAKLLGKPIVMKFSCSGLVLGMKDSFAGRVELAFLRWWASKILILNPGMVDEALEVGFKREMLGWMPNPVDTEFFQPCTAQQRSEYRKELGIEEDTPLVVFVGRLDHQKKLPWVLGSFARVVRERPRAKLALVGDGPLRGQVMEMLKSLQIEKNVIVVGRVPVTGVLKWLHVSDTCVLISEVEGLPCALIEAMSAGVPPVVSNIPAHVQLIDHEVHGLITELGNEESVAKGLIRVLDDPAFRNRMSIAARERMVKEYSTSEVVDRYESLFEECLAKAD